MYEGLSYEQVGKMMLEDLQPTFESIDELLKSIQTIPVEFKLTYNKLKNLSKLTDAISIHTQLNEIVAKLSNKTFQDKLDVDLKETAVWLLVELENLLAKIPTLDALKTLKEKQAEKASESSSAVALPDSASMSLIQMLATQQATFLEAQKKAQEEQTAKTEQLLSDIREEVNTVARERDVYRGALVTVGRCIAGSNHAEELLPKIKGLLQKNWNLAIEFTADNAGQTPDSSTNENGSSSSSSQKKSSNSSTAHGTGNNRSSFHHKGKQAKVVEVPEIPKKKQISPEQTKELTEKANKTLKNFLKPMIRGVKLADGQPPAASQIDKHLEDYQPRANFIQLMLNLAAENEDYSMFIEPHIFVAFFGKYATSIMNGKVIVDKFFDRKKVLCDLAISEAISQIYEQIEDDSDNINTIRDIIANEKSYKTRLDVATKVPGLLTSSEAKGFADLYEMARRFGVFKSKAAEQKLIEFSKDFVVVESLNRLEKRITLAETLDTTEYDKIIKSAYENVIAELMTELEKNHSEMDSCESDETERKDKLKETQKVLKEQQRDFTNDRGSYKAKLQELKVSIDLNHERCIPSIKQHYLELIKQLQTFYTNKYSLPAFYNQYLERWYDDNKVKLESLSKNSISSSQSSTSSATYAPSM